MPFENSSGVLDNNSSLFGNNNQQFGNTGGGSGILGDVAQPFNNSGSMFGGESAFGAPLLAPASGFNNAESFAVDEGFDINPLLPRDSLKASMIHVTRMIVFKTGGYNQQFLRPVTAAANVDVEQVFSHQTNDGTVLTRDNLSRVASSFIMPRAEVPLHNAVQVANGWGTERMRFVMMVDDKSTGTNGTRYFLQGFMDHSEQVSQAGHFNPQARLYFSRAIQMNCLQFSQGGVMNNRFAVNNAANVLSSTYYNTGQGNCHHIRPQDIFAVIGGMKNRLANVQVKDLRSQVVTKPRMSNIANDSMSMFLDSTLRAAREQIDAEYSGNNLHGIVNDRDEAIRGKLLDPTLALMQPMNIMNNQSAWQMNGYMEWRELAAIFPEINREEITKVQTYKNKPQMLAQPNQSEAFNTVNYEGIFATVISQELPPMLLDNSLVRVSFMVDGFKLDQVTRRPIFILSGWEGFDPQLITPQTLETFKTTVLSLIYPRISQNGLTPIKFSVDINIFGDTTIQVSMSDNGPLTPFVIPQFAENTFLSLVTPNQNDLVSIAGAVNTMTKVIEQSVATQFGNSFNW